MVDCGTITVVPAFDPSNVTASCSLGNVEVVPGDQVTVPITVSNENGSTASYTVTMTVDGSTEETLSGTVGANSQTTEQGTYIPGSTGTFNVEIDISAQQA